MTAEQRDRLRFHAALLVLHLKEQGHSVEWIVQDVAERYPLVRNELARITQKRQARDGFGVDRWKLSS
jgi:hypothetical protein